MKKIILVALLILPIIADAQGSGWRRRSDADTLGLRLKNTASKMINIVPNTTPRDTNGYVLKLPDTSGTLALTTGGEILSADTIDAVKSVFGGVGGRVSIRNTHPFASAGAAAEIVFDVNGNFGGSTHSARITAVTPDASNATDIVFKSYAGGEQERMRIKALGNILIGDTTDDGVNKLQVAGPVRVRSLVIGDTTNLLQSDGLTVAGNINGITLNHYNKIYCVGNSLTADGRYETELQRLLGGNWRVINCGISGNTTRQMLDRIKHDILDNGDAEAVILMGGINDALRDSSAVSIESNLQAMYTMIKDAGAKVIAVTITPSTCTPAQQAVKDDVNAWLYSTAIYTDYVVDAYSALEDPSNPDRLLPAYDVGDHLHFTTAGYNELARAIHVGTHFAINKPDPIVTFMGNASFNQSLLTTSSPTFYELNLSRDLRGHNIYGDSLALGEGVYRGDNVLAVAGGVIFDQPTFVLDRINHKIGIGTYYPEGKLDVSQNAAGGVGGRLVVSNYNAGTSAGSAAELAFSANGNFVAGGYSARIKSVTPANDNVADLILSAYNGGEHEGIHIRGSGAVEMPVSLSVTGTISTDQTVSASVGIHSDGYISSDGVGTFTGGITSGGTILAETSDDNVGSITFAKNDRAHILSYNNGIKIQTWNGGSYVDHVQFNGAYSETIFAGRITANALPADSTGLPSGSLYNNSGVVRIKY